MEAYELSKLINSMDSILLQDILTIKTISSTEMWPAIYVCNLYKFVPILSHFCSKIGETLILFVKLAFFYWLDLVSHRWVDLVRGD